MGKPAARTGDMHICPKVEPGPVPHVGGPILQGAANVLIGGMPAARVGDTAVCTGPPDKIISGSATVLINGKPAARMGDSCAHGGTIIIGCPTVFIGDGGGGGGTTAAPSAGGSDLPEPPRTKIETVERMAGATVKVQTCRADGEPLPRSSYATADKQQIIKKGMVEKFILRVISSQWAGDDNTIGRVGESGSATYWTTTFTQLEHADRDAELICQSVGIDYNPQQNYTLLLMLIDQEEAYEEGDMVTFIPTYENLAEFAKKRLGKDFKGHEYLIDAAMTPEYSVYYEQMVNMAKEQNVDLDDKDYFNDLAEEFGFDQNQCDLLQVRHSIAQMLGANEQYLGNGMTKDNTAENPETPFGPARTGYSYGPIEIFTYDKNPRTLGELEKMGIVTRIPLNNP